MKNIDFTNSARAAITDYLTAKANLKVAAAEEKALKAEVEKVFEKYGKAMEDKAASYYAGGFIQQSLKRVGVVWRKTWTKGSIDWQSYALSLGGTKRDAEQFRKPGHWTTSCDYATQEQQVELERRG